MHTIFALFNHADDAAAAIRELETIGTPSDRCTVVLHKDQLELQSSANAPLFETAAAATYARGSLLGGALGALVGALAFGPLGLVAAGPLVGMLFGFAAGVASGGYVGAIAGASEFDPIFKRLAEEVGQGRVLVAVEPPSLESMDRAERILERHGGRIAHRHTFGPTAKERAVLPARPA